MNPRRWTILVVPHDSEAPRQFELGERGVRLLAGIGGGSVLLIIAAVVVLFSPWASPGARMAARANIKLQEEIGRLDASLSQLGDSIGVLAQHEAKFRELAGIPAGDSIRPAAALQKASGTAGYATLGDRPKPFAQYFGNRERPDANALLRRAADLSTAFAAVSDSMARKIEKLRNTPSIMPTAGWIAGAFSSSRLHPILHQMRPHEGVDVSAPMGSPIVAPAGGTVLKVDVESGYGNTLEIDHGNGIHTKYAHCSRIIVRAGQHVERGQMIATVGNTGLSVGPHLHYEVIVDGKHVDPAKYMLPSAAP
ncbi:MAG TPA: M23 family metallopeptidase [Gemmatimonadaceae bacterium]|nr:M23 family metallopeptidase [Gemmatimonadaceae bacterium]